MLKFEEICELIKIVGSTGLARVELEHEGARLSIEGRPQPEVVTAAVPAAAHAQAPAAPAPAGGSGTEQSDDHLHSVTSPIVGTFYRAPNPDAEPYVKVGDFVEKGQVLCIVEAMKLMNEIECETSGKIAKIFPENAEPVEYGQPLFALSTD